MYELMIVLLNKYHFFFLYNCLVFNCIGVLQEDAEKLRKELHNGWLNFVMVISFCSMRPDLFLPKRDRKWV